MEVGGWVQVSLGICLGKSSHNCSKPYCYFGKVVNYYDLSVLSMSVMGFQKKFVCGWVA